MAIMMPHRSKESAIDRLAKGLGIANQAVGTVAGGYQLYRGIKDAAQRDEDREKTLLKEQQEKDPTSPLSQAAREAYAQATGGPLAESVSAHQLESAYGPVSQYSMAAFKAGKDKEAIREKGDQERKTELAKLYKQQTLNPNKFAYEHLPIENQEQIKDIAKKNASAGAIKNEIDSALEILSSNQVSEDQKIKAGQNLLKTLNSTQGQDAVGAEESKRLGSFLEFKIANIRQPGSFWGRDLDQFTDQVALKSAQLGETVAKNEDRINQLYGRTGQPKATGVKIPESVAKRSQRSSDVFTDAKAGAPGAPKGKVRVTNGRESYFIDAKDLPDAIKEGYRVPE